MMNKRRKKTWFGERRIRTKEVSLKYQNLVHAPLPLEIKFRASGKGEF